MYMSDKYDTISNIVETRRTIRRFLPIEIDEAILLDVLNLARLSPSGANRQPLSYVVVLDEKMRGDIFNHVKWAGYISPDGTPSEGERPMGYIAVLSDTTISKAPDIDVGATCMTINYLLEAQGIGVCWMGAIDREAISELLDIRQPLKLELILAIGYKAEQPLVEDISDSIKYYKDEEGVLHVPKRRLMDVVRIING